jgi:hypothetical protein
MSETMTAGDVAAELETNENDIRRAVATWQDCDVAALVDDDGDIGPVTAQGDVVGLNDLSEAPFVLVKINLR